MPARSAEAPLDPSVAPELGEALAASGDGLAEAWDRAQRLLRRRTRVAVAGAHGASLARWERRLREGAPEVEAVPIEVIDDGGPIHLLHPLLGCTALAWITPAGGVLGAEERAALARLPAAGAPRRVAVAISDLELLAQMSDDPERERGELFERARRVAPLGWDVIPAEDLPLWAREVGRDPDAVEERLEEVARLLADHAVAARSAERARELDRLAEIDGALARLDAEIQAAGDAGTRVAAHASAAMRRHAADLVVSLRTFLAGFEDDVAHQALALEDVDLLRRALGPWIHHVVAGQTTDRIATWRARVLADLAEVGVDVDEVGGVDLLTPAVQTGPLRADQDWRQKVGITAAIGGGAALALFGLWLPALVAVGGGLAWRAAVQPERDATTREALIASARSGLRLLAEDLERHLAGQIDQRAQDVDQLAARRRERAADDRREERDRLTTRAALHRARAEAAESVIRRLDAAKPGRRPPMPARVPEVAVVRPPPAAPPAPLPVDPGPPPEEDEGEG